MDVNQQCESCYSTVDSPLSKTSSDKIIPIHRRFDESDVPLRVRKAEYAVRGAVPTLSIEIAKTLPNEKFEKLTPCHLGNPQLCGQQPLSYLRDTLCLVMNPSLMKSEVFLPDTKLRAERYYEALNRAPGAYSESQGASGLRKEVADFLERRDNKSIPIENIWLTSGASEGITALLTCLVDTDRDGVLIPLPQYPLYSATITLLGGNNIYYTLDESSSWALNVADIDCSRHDAEENGITVKILVIISPGNPVPTLLNEEQIKEILQWADEKGILVLADEVYQDNIYDPQTNFVSFRKILHKYHLQTQLASVHSVSKGFYGECGLRGGFIVFDNISECLLKQFRKLRSLSLCSNIPGQIAIACICNPPRNDEPSFSLFKSERDTILKALKQKADIVYKRLNEIDGITCQKINASLYAFPSIVLPEHIHLKANSQNIQPDEFFCLELLKNTGIIATAGSGFGCRGSPYHIRLTILPDFNDMQIALDRFAKFYRDFVTGLLSN